VVLITPNGFKDAIVINYAILYQPVLTIMSSLDVLCVMKAAYFLTFMMSFTLCFCASDLHAQCVVSLISSTQFFTGIEAKVFGGAFIAIIIAVGIFYYRRKQNSTKDLTNTGPSEIITLSSGRLLLFFGSITIAMAAFAYGYITSDFDDKLYLSVAVSIFLLALGILSYVNEAIKSNITIVLTAVYSLVVFYFMFLCYYSNLNPFFIICQIICLSAGTVIFDRTKHFIVFASVVSGFSTIIFLLSDTLEFSPLLYLLATISVLFVSIIATYIRLRLSDRLSFANTVINDGNSIVMAANADGDVIYINKRFTEVLGFTEEEVLGQGWWKVRKVVSNDKDPFSKIKQGEIDSTATVLLETKTGNHRWIQWNNSKLENGIFVGIGSDITERREYEQRFRQLVENAKDIIYTTDRDGVIDYINDVAGDYTGYITAELIGKNYKFLVREDFRKKTDAYYKEQVKNKTRESYREIPFVTKDGQTLWVGQSVLLKYNVAEEYDGAQVICRDITERVLAEERLKQHNTDLNVINLVKEIILASTDTSNMYAKILHLLGANSDKSAFFSINIFDKFQPLLHIYSFDSKEQHIQTHHSQVDMELITELDTTKKLIIEFKEDHQEKELFRQLGQPVDKYSSAVIVPISNTEKTYGFIGFYSLHPDIYQTSHIIMVKDICNSLTNFFVQYEQNQIIESYSRQLEILNEAKARLISYNDLNDVYKGIVELLYDNIDNVFRVSMLIYDFERSNGKLFFKDPETNEVETKTIPLKDVPTISNHLQGVIYEKANFDIDPSLTLEDKKWHQLGVKTVISLPIMIENHLFASVNVLSKVPNNFTDQQKELIIEINESAATVIEQLQFKDIIEAKNKDISDNINYARRIQSAIMPTEDMLSEILPESFLIFSQRDSLGGDFYWFDKRADLIFLAVGDCTGHGVSGSLLTILALDYIKQAVEVRGYTDPGIILEYLNTCMRSTLNKYNTEEELLDGLDISFGVYNEKTKQFLFSSAMHNFYLARNNELTEYKGNRRPIGGATVFENQNEFTTLKFQLEEGDVVYFNTDGFTDQLHHSTEKRYGRIRLKQLLLQINDKDLLEQKAELLTSHLDWKGSQPQTDDICFAAFKV
jgi:PAS domain S-box-containing protein